MAPKGTSKAGTAPKSPPKLRRNRKRGLSSVDATAEPPSKKTAVEEGEEDAGPESDGDDSKGKGKQGRGTRYGDILFLKI